MRDVGSDDVVESGGVVDPDTWKVAVVVSWSSNPVSAETYINDMFDN